VEETFSQSLKHLFPGYMERVYIVLHL